MTLLKNDRLIKALMRQPCDVTPVWIMRQAGRYLPEYKKIRNQAGDFMSLCKNPDLACEVTLQPLQRFPLDAAIIFSDILTIPDAMGLGLYFESGEGPRFKYPVRTYQDIQSLSIPNPNDDLSYVLEAIKKTRYELNGTVPLIGFSGSPWTLATYMIEGGASKDFRRIKAWMYTNPDQLHQLLEKLTDSIVLYLNAQIKAGAQVVQIFDTWGGVLSPECYYHFSLNYMKRIVSKLIKEHEERPVPAILFTKNGGQWLDVLAHAGAQALGVDWTTDLSIARSKVNDKVALQGNLDPSVLYANDKTIREEVRKVLQSFGQGNGHVFNLGHGIHQYIDPNKVDLLIRSVHELSFKQ